MEKIKSPVLAYFADYIEKETGIIYAESNAYQLDNRLKDISNSLGYSGIDELFEKTKDGSLFGVSKQLLLDTATNNETSFFRDPKLFQAFEKFMVPEALKTAGAFDPLRIWSVASSFGQEPYSLAMILDQLQEQGLPLRSAEILTTDISRRALERVNKAVYSHLEVQRGLPATHLIKYFDKLPDDQWQLKPSICKRVTSQYMNLLQIHGINKKFNIIFCRNVLIYQTDEKKREIISKLAEYLVPGGFFVLGAAESLIGLSTAFEQVSHGMAVFYKKKAA